MQTGDVFVIRTPGAGGFGAIDGENGTEASVSTPEKPREPGKM
jgi:N-methylhydantoinase B/oxoprolinase/acetone carboxylase alpha subunit